MNSELKYYLAVFWRRIFLFLVTFFAIASVGVALALTLPTVYRTQATLLIENPEISGPAVESTLQTSASEQLEIIEQRLMTRANLIDIANEFRVYEGLSTISPDAIVRKMRADTEFRATSGRNRATLMNIGFSGRSPQIVTQVTNEYVTRIQRDTLRNKVNKAESNTEFFEKEVERLGIKLDQQSAQILKFQNENADALPDSLEYKLARQTQLQERLSQIARDRAAIQDQKDRLTQIFEATGSIRSVNPSSMTPEQRQLAGLKEELSNALAIYSETHPRVNVLKTKIAQLEQVVAGQSGVPSGPSQDTMFDIQMAELDGKLDFLTEQEEEAQAELQLVAETIRKIPANKISLEALQRDYENTREQYNKAVAALSTAETSERIEILSKGQRVTIIEQATTPTEPASPNRPMLAGGGVALGLIAGLGLILLLEMLNKTIRRPADLTAKLGITPIATIPYIKTSRERIWRRLLLLFLLFLFLVWIPVGLYYVHTNVAPLDLLMERLIERLTT